MVKFVGGPSVNAYKSYSNHRIARPGQFRMPRNYGSVSNRTTIIVRNYNQCNCCAAPRMNWLAAIPMLGDLLNNILGLFKKPEAPKPPVQPEVIEQTVVPDDKTEVKTDPVEEPEQKEEPVTPTPTTKPKTDVNTTITPTTVQTPPTKGDIPTCQVTVEKPIVQNNHKIWQGWQTLQASYQTIDGKPLPNTSAARNEFRRQVLGGKDKDVWNTGTQHFPKEFKFNGVTYYFNEQTFKTPLDIISKTGTVTTANTKPGEAKETPGSTKTTWKATTTFEHDSNGDGDYDDAGDIKLTEWSAEGSTEAEAKNNLNAQINESIKNNQTLAHHKTTIFGSITTAKWDNS